MEEKIKLTSSEWSQRWLTGLPMDGCEMITEKTSAKDRALFETQQRFLAGVDLVGSKRLLDEIAANPDTYPGSFQWRTARILEKVKSQRALQGAGDDVEIVAAYEDRAIAWDIRGGRYFQVGYEMSDSNEITITDVKEMEPKLVVKENQEAVRNFFGTLLAEALRSEGDPLKAKGAVRIARHLVEFGDTETRADSASAE